MSVVDVPTERATRIKPVVPKTAASHVPVNERSTRRSGGSVQPLDRSWRAAILAGVPGRTVVVIPCFDEENRLDPDRVLSLAENHLDVLLVDDGSSDATVALMRSTAARATAERRAGRIDVLEIGTHVGKSEAVRQGLCRATAADVDIVGYCDADFATPPDEVVRLVSFLRRRPDVIAVIGVRVKLLGHEVERPRVRTVGNRAYSTLASFIIGTRIRDTQCGAKFFRTGTALTVATGEPFADAWGFDAELLGRLLVGRSPAAPVDPNEIVEVPLERWTHIPGSKLGRLAAIAAMTDLLHLRRRLRHWRRAAPLAGVE